MNNWLYEEDFNPEEYCGFVYSITNVETGKFYIGKKVFWNHKKRKLTKKQLAEQTGPGRKSSFEIIRVESNWKTYWGSNKYLLEDLKTLGEEHFERGILMLCKTKKQLTYWEMHYQCVSDCLVNPEISYNDNILGKFFTKDLA